MNRLLDIGFEPAGHWLLQEEKLSFALTRHSTQTNILYAFVCDGIVMYVGKTVQSLSKRMAGYRTPGKTQTTNINNHRRIIELIKTGSAIEILALPDNGLMHYGQFHINMAAALEDDIIRKLDPQWNGGKVEQVSPVTVDVSEPEVSAPSDVTATFTFLLQPTYFRSGFFNVGVGAQQHLGGDGETIELFLGDAAQPVLGVINRRANTNGTPRVMGGTKLRDWFQANAREMDVVAVQVLSPTAIQMHTTG
ncbi:MAG: GIY-YIG nuclease family protein [Burkholderiales bacterium]|nr:GIY-YIG nuclease family protein [Burkholderiales bacterium]